MDKPVNMNGLAQALGLPRDWLKVEALNGRIPCLKIGRRMLFNVAAVQQALNDRAATSTVEMGAADAQ